MQGHRAYSHAEAMPAGRSDRAKRNFLCTCRYHLPLFIHAIKTCILLATSYTSPPTPNTSIHAYARHIYTMYAGRRWSLASKSARFVGIPNELQVEILSYLPSRDLLAIITTSRQFLEIIAYILAQRGSMWYLPDCLDINVETSRAAKLWLSSDQGRDLTFIVRLTFTVRHQEDLKSSIQFLSCISAGHTSRLFTTLFLNFFPGCVSELDRSSLELFFSLIHQLASPTIHIYSMMGPDRRPSSPLFAVHLSHWSMI